MSESLHIKECPACASKLSIRVDNLDDTVAVMLENVPPLARDCKEIVSAYKQLKGLGVAWERDHGSRGIVYASRLIEAAGPLGGAQERVLGLLAWLKESGKDFDLGTASSYFMSYSAHLAEKMAASRGRCKTCGESYTGSGRDCGRHF